MQVLPWTLSALILGSIIYYVTEWVEFGVFIYTCFVGLGLVTLFSYSKSPEEGDEQCSQGQNANQLFLVFFFFLCTIVGVFVVSVWVIYAGITTSDLKQDIKSVDNDSSHTIVIANSLIWTFAILSLLIYALSRIGFRISEMAHKGIANAVAGENLNSHNQIQRNSLFISESTTFVY